MTLPGIINVTLRRHSHQQIFLHSQHHRAARRRGPEDAAQVPHGRIVIGVRPRTTRGKAREVMVNISTQSAEGMQNTKCIRNLSALLVELTAVLPFSDTSS